MRRVRGYSKNPGSSSTAGNKDDLDLDDTIMLGDILALKIFLDKNFAVLAFVKIMSMKHKDGGKHATVIPSFQIGEYTFEGCILESKLSRNVIYVSCKNTNELCKSIDGSFCVIVQLNNSNIEKEKVFKIFDQIPISDTKLNKSKLLPYEKSLKECIESKEKDHQKLKCKLWEQQVMHKKMRKNIASYIYIDKKKCVVYVVY